MEELKQIWIKAENEWEELRWLYLKEKIDDIPNKSDYILGKVYEAGYRKQSDTLKEIIDVIELRMAQSKEQRKGVSSELWTGIYEGKEYAYRDIKEIIEAK